MINGIPPMSQSFGQGSAGGEGENADLKAQRKQELRKSLKDGIEAFKISEQKKNIDALR